MFVIVVERSRVAASVTVTVCMAESLVHKYLLLNSSSSVASHNSTIDCCGMADA